MKNSIKFLILSVLFSGLISSCADDYLDTVPTDKVDGTTIFKDANSAQTAINGSYSMLWRAAFGSSNTTHSYGHQSTLFAQDLMADDAVQMAFNWFGWDYDLDYTSRINVGTGSRSYNVWNMLYTVISNVNYIIAEDGKIAGDQTLANSIVAQAYALRAFCYFELIQGFQKTYLGNENAPGVPVYTEPTRAGDEGKPRGTVAEVYTRINEDLESAIALFTSIGKPKQSHCSNIDYYVAKGFQARVALVQGKWDLAYSAANEAMSRTGLRLLNSSEILDGMSDLSLASNLWVMEMIPDQSPIYGSLYCFLDPYTSTAYGNQQRKCISSWLYDKIANPEFDDARADWFKDENQGSAKNGINVNYGQMKRLAKELANWVGDIIYMRGEEMLLIKAEAKARLGSYGEARQLLNELAAVRLKTSAAREAYSTYLDGLDNAFTIPTADTNVNPSNVLEEVILQRRIELWGELGRIKDILRLKQGYNRVYAGSNHVEPLVGINTGPESGAFLFKIPQTEFDGNTNILSSEQNPTN